MKLGPILITTPRTGSTVICKLLGNIAKCRWEYRNILYEYFDPSPSRRTDYDVAIVFDKPAIVKKKQHILLPDSFTWTTKEQLHQLQRDRIALLRNTGPHMVKLFPDHINNDIYKFIIEYYAPFYLERRDKFAQLISLLAIHPRNINPTHYLKKDATEVNKIHFDINVYKSFISTLLLFNKIKNTQPGPVMYYEDFISGGSNQQVVLDCFQIDGCGYLTEPEIITRPTMYRYTDEDIFSNQDEWRRYRSQVVEETHQLSVLV